MDAGVVDVLYGSAGGVTGGGSQQLTQALPESGDELGWALAAGDFNGDNFADLAVGAPGEAVGARADAGAVEVYAGGSLPPSGGVLLFQDAPGVPGTSETGDIFGVGLASSFPGLVF